MIHFPAVDGAAEPASVTAARQLAEEAKHRADRGRGRSLRTTRAADSPLGAPETRERTPPQHGAHSEPQSSPTQQRPMCADPTEDLERFGDKGSPYL
jgi:hypothetical protein